MRQRRCVPRRAACFVCCASSSAPLLCAPAPRFHAVERRSDAAASLPLSRVVPSCPRAPCAATAGAESLFVPQWASREEGVCVFACRVCAVLFPRCPLSLSLSLLARCVRRASPLFPAVTSHVTRCAEAHYCTHTREDNSDETHAHDELTRDPSLRCWDRRFLSVARFLPSPPQ